MDQNVNNRHKEILWDLLANPAENGRSYKQSLEQLVQDNPQSGLLQVLYARTADAPDIKTASAYFSPKALHKLINDPDGLLPVSRERINKPLNGSHAAAPENYFNIGTAEIEAEEPAKISDEPVAEEESLVTQELAQPLEGFAAAEEAPQAEAELALPPYEEKEEPYITPPVEQEPDQPEAEAPAEQPVEEGIEEQQPIAEQPTYEQVPVAAADDEDSTYTNPWDFSQLEEPAQEITVTDADQEEEQPEPEAKPEPAAENAPVVEEPKEEPKIDTYDHSLSAFEQAAVTKAEESPAEEDKAEVSSFADYRPENVFHRQDYIEDDVFDEIVSIDEIGVEGLNNTFSEDITADEDAHKESPESTPAEDQPDLYADTEKLIYGNIAATDYLSFDKKLDELRSGIPSAQQTPSAAETPEPVLQPQTPGTGLQSQPATTEAPKEQDVVSKYDDDTMPYSFMWWLDKTRKEHAGPYQPYAKADKQQPAAQTPATPSGEQTDREQKAGADELQQQYYANIFSLTSVSSIGEIEPAQIEFDHSKKEDVIIERFIHTDPQIKPLSADKLDNENKAKRSSEDQDIMVTETLARIYTDQMLYHKAIATYKKLMLKIPEKKLYFASQIEQLEKKIN